MASNIGYNAGPPSSSLSGYGLGPDEAPRSTSSGSGTPGLLNHQPISGSGDNTSEAGDASNASIGTTNDDDPAIKKAAKKAAKVTRF